MRSSGSSIRGNPMARATADQPADSGPSTRSALRSELPTRRPRWTRDPPDASGSRAFRARSLPEGSLVATTVTCVREDDRDQEGAGGQCHADAEAAVRHRSLHGGYAFRQGTSSRPDENVTDYRLCPHFCEIMNDRAGSPFDV